MYTYIGIMLQFLVSGLVEALESNRTMLLHASGIYIYIHQIYLNLNLNEV